MTEQPKSDRTSVTISKRVHQDFKVACAQIGVPQRDVLENIIRDWLRGYGEWRLYPKKEE